MQSQFKKTLLISALALMGSVSGVAHAEEAAPAAAEPVDTLAFNAGVISEYRYRGISQSRLLPAVQGGADFTSKDGWYLGTWFSSIDWIKDYGTIKSTKGVKGPVELDLYGGYRGELATDLTYDVGYLRYEYAGNTLAKISGFANANTDEVYGALTYKIFTAKYSYSLGDLFGTVNSKGSGYTDLSLNFDLGDGLSFVPHLGHQTVAGNGNSVYSYTDYSLTLGKDFGNGFSASAALIGTDAKTGSYVAPSGKSLSKSDFVAGVKYTF